MGVIIEGNYIHDSVSINSGENPGGIRMDSAKDWIVRNNRIHTVCGNSGEGGCRYVNSGCIYSYYIWNATVENNVCSNSGAGVHWKDHIVDLTGNPTHTGSIVQYNLIYNTSYGFYISHGNRDPESSNHTATNNIFYNMGDSCMQLVTDTSNDDQSVGYRFDNNVCDGADAGIYSLSAQVVSSQGNIFSDMTGYPTPAGDGGIYNFYNDDDAQLDGSDYNVFLPDFYRVRMEANTANVDYNSLSAWQSATPADALSVNVTNPDQNSIESTEAAIFQDAGQRDYRLANGSPALNLISSGNSAGAYKTGNEIIGLLPGHLNPIITPKPLSNFRKR